MIETLPEIEISANFYTERRIGRFEVLRPLIEDYADVIAAAMAGMIVVRAEHRLDMDAIEYMAFSPQFDPVPKFEIAPLYRVMVTEHTDDEGRKTLTTEFVRR
jgi:hypothetical protein